jgi:membrane-associated PAP2 superfamily phosphatase
MNKMITQLLAIPLAARRLTFFAALAFTFFMAVIPGESDPTAFINDKLKHAITFMVLFALFDLAYPKQPAAWWKPLCLLAFGVLIEVCQKMTGYRHFSVGDILADGAGILGYLVLWVVFRGSVCR